MELLARKSPSDSSRLSSRERRRQMLKSAAPGKRKQYHARNTRVPAMQPRSTCGKVLTENRPTCYLSSYRDYSPKPFSKAECIRSGTASGERRNNPHPPEGFMVWRLPTRRRPHQDASDMEEPLHPDLGIIRGHLKSTYRDDYRENYKLPPLQECLPADLERPIPNYSPDSIMRQSYQRPVLTSRLQAPKSRYACNATAVKPARGALPTLASKPIISPLRSRKSTQYAVDYGSRPSVAPREELHLPKLEDRSRTMTGVSRSSSTSSDEMPPTTRRVRFRPIKDNEWVSEWPGPVF